MSSLNDYYNSQIASKKENAELEQAEANEAATQEFYQTLFEFCADQDIELTESAVAEFAQSGIFEEAQKAQKAFYEQLYDFCVENEIPLTESAVAEIAASGILESEENDNSTSDNYASMLEFCSMNGIQLNSEQIQALKNKVSE